jgi:hypothetical protein
MPGLTLCLATWKNMRIRWKEIELDVIALCCEYSEHKSALDAAADYGYDVDDESEENAMQFFRDNTHCH